MLINNKIVSSSNSKLSTALNQNKLDKFPLYSGVEHAEKYQSGNFIANKLVTNFLSSIVTTVSKAGNIDVHEIGCGEGHILATLASCGFNVKGCDLSRDALTIARNEIKLHGFDIEINEKNIYELNPTMDSSDTVLCCEVLEHLTDPDLALKNLISITKKDLILSVPNEPVWHILNLIRGKYWNAMGNTPGHYQHWTKNSFVAFVSNYADVISVSSPLPWTIIHCKPKKI